MEVTRVILKKVEEHCSVRMSKHINQQVHCVWQPPPTGWYKVSIDASFLDGKSFAVFVGRDHNENIFLLEACESFAYNPTTAEV